MRISVKMKVFVLSVLFVFVLSAGASVKELLFLGKVALENHDTAIIKELKRKWENTQDSEAKLQIEKMEEICCFPHFSESEKKQFRINDVTLVSAHSAIVEVLTNFENKCVCRFKIDSLARFGFGVHMWGAEGIPDDPGGRVVLDSNIVLIMEVLDSLSTCICTERYVRAKEYVW